MVSSLASDIFTVKVNISTSETIMVGDIPTGFINIPDKYLLNIAR